jgi:hypothetical protein
MKNSGFKTFLLLVGGICLLIYAISSFPSVVLNGVFPFSLGMAVIATGAISLGFSGIGAKWLAIPFGFATALGLFFLLLEVVHIFAFVI